jgi:hypothetical protein
MFDFHARHGIRAINSTGRRDENGRDIIRWCFADPKLAERFAKLRDYRRGGGLAEAALFFLVPSVLNGASLAVPPDKSSLWQFGGNL